MVAVAVEHGKQKELFEPLAAGLDRIIRWLEQLASNTAVVREKDFERYEAVWSGGLVRAMSVATCESSTAHRVSHSQSLALRYGQTS